ncbi:MAG: chorismate mutase [Fibrobacter sp.]|nr:chorismate mutase [Fibrobacter sp.]
MDISDWRNRIDALEDMLILLLNKRASYAVEIGKIKKEQKMPVLDPSREQIILDRVASKTEGPLSPEALRRIFKTIIEETRKIEE